MFYSLVLKTSNFPGQLFDKCYICLQMHKGCYMVNHGIHISSFVKIMNFYR